nr:F0F1 ATP synthase subunit gamma [Propionibacterium sp.]
MGAGLRELRQRRKSVTSTKKITKAMELIAASKIIKAQHAANEALPYTRELNRAVAAVATRSTWPHPMTRPKNEPDAPHKRAALIFFTSDRGMNGAYSSNAIKTAARMASRLRAEGKEVKRYAVGKKGIDYLAFRDMEIEASWSGFSDSPKYDNARDIANRLIEDFLKPHEEGGVDEIWAVYTRMESMLTQTPRVRRLLPLEVVEGLREIDPHTATALYDFEPDPETVLNELMPLYIRSRVWFYLLQSAASQLASQQRAMKSATDNAEQLIEDLTRQENQARQSEITQEINEIVGGASALSESQAAD